MTAGKRTPEELRVLAAAFLGIRVGELLPYLQNATNNSSIARTEYLADCPSCGQHVLSFKQGRSSIVAMYLEACPIQSVAAAIVERRLQTGEHPENLWGRADRLLRGEEWNP